MRRTSVAALVAVSIGTVSVPVHAQIPPQVQIAAQYLTPSPLGIVLTLGTWLNRDSKKVYYVEVEGAGADPFTARNNGFKLAVEQAVGALVLRETEVKNMTVVRNDIITYSSGYVDDFKITGETRIGAEHRVRMQVWVSNSKIADRLLAESRAQQPIPSERMATQIDTVLKSKADGDRMLNAVLADYPKRSFRIEIGSTKSWVENRQGVVTLDYTLQWDHNYTRALQEALTAIGPNRKYQVCLVSSNGQGCNTNAKTIHVGSKQDSTRMNFNPFGHNSWVKWEGTFDDDVVFNMMTQTFIDTPITILAHFHSKKGGKLGVYCYDTDWIQLKQGYWKGVNVLGNRAIHSALVFPQEIVQGKLHLLDKVEVEVVKTQKGICPGSV